MLHEHMNTARSSAFIAVLCLSAASCGGPRQADASLRTNTKFGDGVEISVSGTPTMGTASSVPLAITSAVLGLIPVVSAMTPTMQADAWGGGVLPAISAEIAKSGAITGTNGYHVEITAGGTITNRPHASGLGLGAIVPFSAVGIPTGTQGVISYADVTVKRNNGTVVRKFHDEHAIYWAYNIMYGGNEDHTKVNVVAGYAGQEHAMLLVPKIISIIKDDQAKQKP
jgi:hypothetical protein